MGTTWSVKVANMPPGLEAKDLFQRIDRKLAWVNGMMSTYDPESELSRFNATGSTAWFEVSKPLAELVDRAQAYAILSDGAFDVTVGPAVRLWGFGPDGVRFEPPADDAVAAVLERIGYAHLQVRHSPPGLRKARADLDVDLSAIAKGYGVDQIAAVLDEAGMSDYLVEIGGELRASGKRPDGNPWRIAVERPDPATREVYGVVELSDAAMATSGDYRNFFEHAGKLYSHTIDPARARPVEHSLASVSVIAENCASADALATTLLVLGPERGFEAALGQGAAVLFVLRAGDGFEHRATPAFEKYLVALPGQ